MRRITKILLALLVVGAFTQMMFFPPERRPAPPPPEPVSGEMKLSIGQAIRRQGYICGHADVATHFMFSTGFSVRCDTWGKNPLSYEVELKPHTGQWVVTTTW